MNVLKSFIESRNFAGIAEFVSKHFSMSLNPTNVVDILAKHSYVGDVSLWKGWSESSWLTWFKVQLIKNGFMPAGCTPNVDFYMTTPLHVFFVHLDESPTMLANLTNGDTCPKSQVATSKIFRTSRIPTPVDRVAAMC